MEEYEYLSAEDREELSEVGATQEQWDKQNQSAKLKIDRKLYNYGHARFSGILDTSYNARVVVIGATGAGKSATANTILGERGHFVESSSASSVTTGFSTAKTSIDGREVTIYDTPGSWNNDLKDVNCFIIVVNLASPRFDVTTRNVLEKYKFVKSKRCVVVLSHADSALRNKTLSEYLDGIRGDPLYIFIQERNYLAVNNSAVVDYERRRNQKAIMAAVQRTFVEPGPSDEDEGGLCPSSCFIL